MDQTVNMDLPVIRNKASASRSYSRELPGLLSSGNSLGTITPKTVYQPPSATNKLRPVLD